MSLTRLSWVCIKLFAKGRAVVSYALPGGSQQDDPKSRYALHLKFVVVLISQFQLIDRVRHCPLEVSPGGLTRSWFLWRNFNICPRCQEKGRPYILARLSECGPVTSRSDGMAFHLFLGDKPIEYPAEKAMGKTQMMSAGFWCILEAIGDSTETVVVILRRPLSGGVPLLRRLETAADSLAEKLCIQSRLACL